MIELNLKAYDVRDKIVVISDAEISEEQMGDISSRIKKAGAIEVIYAYQGVDLKLLSDEDLKNIGLCRINGQKKPKSTKNSGKK